jgi:hypothetical protein
MGEALQISETILSLKTLECFHRSGSISYFLISGLSLRIGTFFIFCSKANYGSGPASKLVSKLGIAAWCGLVGALFTFPGLRLARMHRDALTYNESSVLRSVFVIVPPPHPTSGME